MLPTDWFAVAVNVTDSPAENTDLSTDNDTDHAARCAVTSLLVAWMSTVWLEKLAMYA